jgi:hypothetical protein
MREGLHGLRGDSHYVGNYTAVCAVILVQPQCRSRLDREFLEPLWPAGSEKMFSDNWGQKYIFGARLNSRALGDFLALRS